MISIRPLAALAFTALFSLSALAKEGMWIPSRIKQMVGDDMIASGMKISPEELYAINGSSIKDAVVHFGGGCTSVLVSEEGLLLTNHHCGYSRIQSHSTLEHNYLADGFWAMAKSEELPNQGLTASIIKEIRDISKDIESVIPENATEEERQKAIAEKEKAMIAAATEGTHYEAYTKAFYFGNQFLLFITETFEDVRLVGAPPSSIGKFGFDTDNWVWPRHTGDFSVFRVYANAENKPAAFSDDNKPYKPAHYLPVNLNGANENDFTIVYGFPGRTDNYISSGEVSTTLEVINPQRIKMRKASLSVIDAAMRSDKQLNIMYAAKQSRISNAYKKWIGQSRGLIRHKAVAKKDSLEMVFNKRVNEKPAWKTSYGSITNDLNELAETTLPLDVGRNYFVEYYYYGPEILRFAASYSELVKMSEDEAITDEEIEAWIAEHIERKGYWKNYSVAVDKDIMKAQLPITIADLKKYMNYDLIPESELAAGMESYVNKLYSSSAFASPERLTKMLSKYKRKKSSVITNDPAYLMAQRMSDMYFKNVRPELSGFVMTNDSLMRNWMSGLMEVIPEKTYYADANSTLRITYGKVEGYTPFDGAEYMPYTTLEGIIAKADPESYEFAIPQRLEDLYEAKDYGRYADANGKLRVAFISSNHTSGGNSGSPVIDANGQLIGLNFDRTWESTMSDIMFNPIICRNITVDIRYVCFIMDKFAGAGHLVEEMSVVER